MLSTQPDLLDVTLRDGAYVVNFQFTAGDTRTIVRGLAGAGVRWIEVGHGLGLGASRAGRGQAAASDAEYLEAAAEAAGDARWGMFFIPGIGCDEDLTLAAGFGMSFVRVGTNITEHQRALRWIERARELGLFVSYNAMKSYAVLASDFARRSAEAARAGAQVVCLVDSAGTMEPQEVRAYLRAAREASDAALGFHGHDNLSLAVANTLAALESGATLVDASLHGMGRSGGNACTEIVVALLQRRGLLSHIDRRALDRLARQQIARRYPQRQLDPLTVTAGACGLHSSFLPEVLRVASRYAVDPHALMERVCEHSVVEAPAGLLERLARELAGGGRRAAGATTASCSKGARA